MPWDWQKQPPEARKEILRSLAARRSLRASAQSSKTMYPGQGPLAGIHAALATSTADLNLIIAVDMPFLRPEFLSYLIVQAHTTTAAVVVPKTVRGYVQPLARRVSS